MVHRTLTAAPQKSREVQLSRHREASEGSDDEACLRRENELVETGEGRAMGIGENVFVRERDSMSVDTLLVWWQGKNCKYAW